MSAGVRIVAQSPPVTQIEASQPAVRQAGLEAAIGGKSGKHRKSDEPRSNWRRCCTTNLVISKLSTRTPPSSSSLDFIPLFMSGILRLQNCQELSAPAFIKEAESRATELSLEQECSSFAALPMQFWQKAGRGSWTRCNCGLVVETSCCNALTSTSAAPLPCQPPMHLQQPHHLHQVNLKLVKLNILQSLLIDNGQSHSKTWRSVLTRFGRLVLKVSWEARVALS